jgi:hypothetical protein
MTFSAINTVPSSNYGIKYKLFKAFRSYEQHVVQVHREGIQFGNNFSSILENNYIPSITL